MKYLKIILAILAVVGIIAAIYFGYTKTTDVDNVGLPENQFTRRINQEIIEISNKPNSRFCKDAYDVVKYHINDYASMNRLGRDSTDVLGNSQNQQYLFKTLYSAYADKFIAQSDFVFKGSTWSQNDLNFIKAETSRLRTEGQNSECLEKNGTVDKDFSRLIRTIESYDDELKFIKDCRRFSFNKTDLETSFPLDQAQSIINVSKSHLSSLGIVKNSDVITNGLSDIPDKVLSAHVAYLRRKLNEWKGFYMYYATLAAYKTNLYDKLTEEISLLDNSMYSDLNVSSHKTTLLNTLDEDYRAAKTYFQNK